MYMVPRPLQKLGGDSDTSPLRPHLHTIYILLKSIIIISCIVNMNVTSFQGKHNYFFSYH